MRDDTDVEDKPTGRRSRYTSRKDVIAILVILAVLAAVALPAYQGMVREGQKVENKENLRAIWNAISTYSQDNNDRLPPTYYELGDGVAAHVDGLPVAWPTLVASGLGPRASFMSRAAQESEVARVVPATKSEKGLAVTYGMYRGLSCVPTTYIPSENESILLTDSANRGARGSFDPSPLLDEEGKPADHDGFVLGWDDSNREYTPETKRVTRLAVFREGGKVVTRFGKSLYGVTAAGQLVELAPGDDEVDFLYPTLTGAWWADPKVYR
ncbi:MAG: hypothetical protein IT207_03615 [Fimbriimonadaceae bacterium]|nr:hypothetical protein [Fimbriimonadaceae bacterium]